MAMLVSRISVVLTVLLANLLLVSSAAANAPKRLAVVFANSKYASLGELKNPAQDGQLVAAALRSAGFDVEYRRDLDDQGFRAALRQLARDSAKYDVTLVYYAGHGVQLNGINYLLPVDIKPPEEADDIRLGSVSADDVLSVLKSPYRILVLDACRENPVLGRAMSRGRGVGFKQGLAPVSPTSDNAGGVFIAYSTQADAVAQDGEGADSPFAESFAKHVGTNVSIDDMFALVTRDVLQATKGFQRPFKYASLDTVFCLSGVCSAGDAKTQSIANGGGSLLAGDARQLSASLAQLSAATNTRERTRIEQSLADQLRVIMPKTVLYGSTKTADGKELFYGFDPASVREEGPDLEVTLRAFQAGANGTFTPTGWVAHESLNCQTDRLVEKDWEMNGNVKFYTQAEQTSQAIALVPGAVGKGLEGALCSPLRFVPLWAIESLDWVRIGAQAELARGVTFQEAPGSDTRYIFGRLDRDSTDDYGGNREYGWLAINCKTRQFDASRGYSVKKPDSVVGVFGMQGKWTDILETSPAHNAYVMLCDKPQ